MDAYYWHGGCYGYLLFLWMPVIAIVVATNTHCCYGSLSQIIHLLWICSVAMDGYYYIVIAMDGCFYNHGC